MALIKQTMSKQWLTPLRTSGSAAPVYSHKLPPFSLNLVSSLLYQVQYSLLSQYPANRGRVKALSTEQVKVFMDAIIYSPWKVFFSLLLDSGMRPGEALELKWDDVDFENEKVTINRTLSHTRKDSIPELYLLKIILGIKNWKLEEPKTKRSRRTIPLTGQVVRNLKEHQKDQKAQILKAEPGTYLKHNFIFAANNGEPIYEQNIYNRHFIPLIEKAGLPQIRLYDLRHTCATLLLSAGENPKVVSEWLGHASIVLTLDTYSHVLPNMQQGATQKLENILYPESEAAK